MFYLKSDNELYYTGKAGDGFVASGAENAFAYATSEGANAKRAVLNRGSALHGLTFDVVELESVCMYIEDACGSKYCYTVADDSHEAASRFREHAAWFKRTGYKSLTGNKSPALPLRTVIEPYTTKG